jgi:ATP-dependent protease Clp ATPase subunit
MPALIRVLTEPRHALVRQYQALFEIEGVDLRPALKAVARQAAVVNGARAVRTILEEVMLDLMYDVPAHSRVKSVVITEDVIAGITHLKLHITGERSVIRGLLTFVPSSSKPLCGHCAHVFR